MNIQSPVLIVAIPLMGAFLCPIVGAIKRKFSYYWATGVIISSFICAIDTVRMLDGKKIINYWLGGWAPPFGIEYVVDSLNGFVVLIVLFMSLLTVIYSKKDIEKELPDKITYFYTVFLLLISGLTGIVMTGDLFNLYVFLEISSLSAYALIASGKGRSSFASFRYIVMGTVGACFYLIGIGYLYIATGSLNMIDIRYLLPPLYSNSVIQTGFIFIIIGFALKIAFFPLHSWQPDAYTYSPSSVSVIISTAMAKTSVYALIRIIFSVFTVDFIKSYDFIWNLISWLSASAMIIGSLYAIRQVNLKRMLAYSSISNVGYIMLGVGLSTQSKFGLAPAIMHILNHAIMKGCMFMTACAFIYRLGLWNINSFKGLGRRMPLTSFAFLLSALSMIGLPPSVGFITKWYLMLAVLDAGKYVFAFVILVSTLLMIIYFWRVIEIMYIRHDDIDQNILVQDAPPSMLVPEVILALLCFVLGVVWMSGIFSPIIESVNLEFNLGV